MKVSVNLTGGKPANITSNEPDTGLYFTRLAKFELGKTNNGEPALIIEATVTNIFGVDGALKTGPAGDNAGKTLLSTVRIPETPERIKALTGKAKRTAEFLRDNFNRVMESILSATGTPAFAEKIVRAETGFEFDTEVVQANGYAVLLHRKGDDKVQQDTSWILPTELADAAAGKVLGALRPQRDRKADESDILGGGNGMAGMGGFGGAPGPGGAGFGPGPGAGGGGMAGMGGFGGGAPAPDMSGGGGGMAGMGGGGGFGGAPAGGGGMAGMGAPAPAGGGFGGGATPGGNAANPFA